MYDDIPAGGVLRQQRIDDPYIRLRCMARETAMTPQQLTDIEQGLVDLTVDQFAMISAAASRGCDCPFCGGPGV